MYSTIHPNNLSMLVDITSCHNMFSFMDGSSVCNQIKMDEEDKSKTTFITIWVLSATK